MTPKVLWKLVKEAGQEWLEGDVFRLSASIAYFAIFSLAPLLVIVLFVVGIFWSDRTGYAQTQIISQIRDLTGNDGAELIRILLENANRPGSGGVMATVVGIGTLLFGATAVFVQMKAALNTIWGIEATGMGIKGFFRSRILSFGLILVVGFLLLVSLILSAAVAAADEVLTDMASGFFIVIRLSNILIDLGVITVLFALIYRYLPDIRLAWKDVWVGAIITAILFDLGKLGIGTYLGNSSIASTYGAAGSLAVLLIWVYYSALIVFFGAELTQAYIRHFDKRSPFSSEGNADSIPGVKVRSTGRGAVEPGIQSDNE